MSPAGVRRISGVLAALLVPIPAVCLFFNENWYSFFHSYSLAMFFGILSYGYFCLALILSCRIHWLDRLYGHDRILVFHGILASLALLLAGFHAVFKILYFPGYNLQIILGASGILLFTLIMLLTVIFMVKTPLNRLIPAARILDWLNKRVPLDYSLLKLVHSLTSAALLIIVVHVLLAWPVQETITRTVLMGSMGILAIMLFVYHKVARPLICYMRSWRVGAVRTLGHSITEIEMERPGCPSFFHRPGQFCYFRFMSGVCGRAEHPFTISSSPGSSRLTVTVKALGDYSTKLANLPAGTRALVDGPYGIFSPISSTYPMLFLAGGIGITPFLSILRHYLDHPPCSKILLIWSVHNPEELFGQDELQSMKENCSYFDFDIRVTGGINPLSGKRDVRLDKSFIEQRIVNLPGKNNIEVYICGPESFRLGTMNVMQSLQVHSSKIHFEKFSF